MTLADGFILGAALLTAVWLLSPTMRASRTWSATLTPLASIIGSGFLVAAPLVAVIVGKAAPLAMLGIVVLAYGIGSVIRFNIRHLEPRLTAADYLPRPIIALERVSAVALAVAYIVSVTFYLRLLASFVLHQFQNQVAWHGNLLTTGVLLVIGLTGYRFGLRALEKLETISVTVKLAIIAALLLGLGMFDVGALDDLLLQPIPVADHETFHRLRLLAGLLLIVQGFETSRYLGHEYDAATRIETMRRAQLLSGTIYVVFVLFALPLLTRLEGTSPDETAIIALAQHVSPLLPYLLILAAVMSQFSAAVADTVGGGGLLAECSRGSMRIQSSYLLITATAIALVWFADIFQIISIASRAFALYYLLQAINAWLLAGEREEPGRRLFDRARFTFIILILTFVVIFGHSAE